MAKYCEHINADGVRCTTRIATTKHYCIKHEIEMDAITFPVLGNVNAPRDILAYCRDISRSVLRLSRADIHEKEMAKNRFIVRSLISVAQAALMAIEKQKRLELYEKRMEQAKPVDVEKPTSALSDDELIDEIRKFDSCNFKSGH